MAYFVNLYSPDTWNRSREFGGAISGFRIKQEKWAQRIRPGDILVCYLTGYSRWCGISIVESPAFIDSTPLYGDPDPFVVRFRVRPEIQLEPSRAIPISHNSVWSGLSFTRDVPPGSSKWTGRVRSSLTQLDDADGELLVRLLREEAIRPTPFPFTEDELRRVSRKGSVATPEGQVSVQVPDRTDDEPPHQEREDAVTEPRESLKMQAAIADLGAKLGFQIWVPASDRLRILELASPHLEVVTLDRLPLNYDDVTLRTIENIDVIWLRGRAMARAFEVEHTTSIYSGILRMADLLSLQPNMRINLHIVAPEARREKVLQEISRPVFSLLASGPLKQSCTYIGYDAVAEITAMPHLQHMRDDILSEFEEAAD